MKKLTIDNFILKAKKINGNKYDYSQSIYVNGNTKIEIICHIHGIFNQTPNAHLNGQGCPKCWKEMLRHKFQKSKKQFIEDANLIHKNFYDYSKIEYKNNKTNIEIICPVHGSFFQSPQNHIQQKQGCPKCGIIKCGLSGRGNTNDFVKQSKQIHKSKYDYRKVKYIKNDIKVEIICPKHSSFWQTPNNHLNGQECPKCKNKISKQEIEFLDYMKISQNDRQKYIKPYKVDGIKNKIVYEFLGDYYHGNPAKYNPVIVNKKCHKTFGKLYENTMEKFRKLKSLDYNIKYIWESDWNNYKKGYDFRPNILEY